MKALLLSILVIFSLPALAQDPASYFQLFDNKVYSLKTKAVKDFVVDISSSRLTKQMNEQKTFGRVKDLVFRIYWTAQPERLAVEILGLPEGFREVKEELKMSILGIMDNLLPLTLPQRFAGYKFSPGKNPREFMATDTTGLAGVPSFIIKFDSQDRLTDIIANRAVGSSDMKLTYDKRAFSDGRWVLLSAVTTASENGQTLISSRELDYGSHQGMGVLESVKITTQQKWEKADVKPVTQSEELTFSRYQINTGAAMKYFLGEASSKAAE